MDSLTAMRTAYDAYCDPQSDLPKMSNRGRTREAMKLLKSLSSYAYQQIDAVIDSVEQFRHEPVVITPYLGNKQIGDSWNGSSIPKYALFIDCLRVVLESERQREMCG